MKTLLILMQLLCTLSIGWAQSDKSKTKLEAEYYIAVYARHYSVPVALVRAIVQRESNWQICAVSTKGAVGLMQLMPVTAMRLGVEDPCDADQNIAGGVRYLAWLMRRFHNDLRLVTAAYYAGENMIEKRGLAYRNPDVIAYVSAIRETYLHEMGIEPVARARMRKEM